MNRLALLNLFGLSNALVYTHEFDFLMIMRLVTALVIAWLGVYL